jgi:nitrogen fixation NifU-like protein
VTAASYELYQERILEHYKHPRNKGALDAPSHQAKDSNPLCGDEITLYLAVDGSGTIADVRFSGQGCAISLASASMLTEGLKGTRVADAKALGRDDVLKRLGIPLSAVRMKCALLSLQVLRRALGVSVKES